MLVRRGRGFGDISVAVERSVLGWFGGDLRCFSLGRGFGDISVAVVIRGDSGDQVIGGSTNISF